jgi:hypothetical protein
VTADSVYITPIEDRIEVKVEETIVDIAFEETTVVVVPATDTAPVVVEVRTAESTVEVVRQDTEVIVSADETVVVVTPGGEQGPPGPAGPPGPGSNAWGPPDTILTVGVTQLSNDCSNYIQVDCTAGNIEIRLPSFEAWLTRALRIVRTSSGSNLIKVTAAGDISGIPIIELAYRGECLEVVAQENGWWIQ